MLWDTAFVLVCDYKTSECVGKVLVLLGIQTRNRFINTTPIPPINDTDYRLYGLLLYVQKRYIFPTVFAKMSCMMNPLLYGLTNSSLRRELRHLWQDICCQGKTDAEDRPCHYRNRRFRSRRYDHYYCYFFFFLVRPFLFVFSKMTVIERL